MGATYRFIADPSVPSPVVEWFRALPFPPKEIPTDRGMVLYFAQYGSLSYELDGSIIPKQSAVATLFRPRVERGVLWTVGELHFLATPLRERYPELHKVSSAFSRWLQSHVCVYSNKSSENEFAYFLEGSIKSYDPPVYAFESGLAELRSGRYFVGDSDNEHVLSTLCKALRLRGLDCAQI
jgi:hypothetical protein